MDSPGQLVGYIHCRTCYRCVHVDPAAFPPAPVPESYRARRQMAPRCGSVTRASVVASLASLIDVAGVTVELVIGAVVQPAKAAAAAARIRK